VREQRLEPEIEGITGGTELHDEELHNLYSSPDS
jgi:hypothetical protein